MDQGKIAMRLAILSLLVDLNREKDTEVASESLLKQADDVYAWLTQDKEDKASADVHNLFTVN